MSGFAQRVMGFLILCMLVLVVPLFAQEWSAEQKEAWAFELSYWKALHDGDVDKTLDHIHDDYTGWGYGDSIPHGKAAYRKSFTHSFPKSETFHHEETPILITVLGNVAVVHYIASWHGSGESGEHSSVEARWSDTLLNENGRWLLISDHGGSTSP